MGTHLRVVEAILPIAPGAKDQFGIDAGVYNIVGPVGRHHYAVAWTGGNRDAATGVISGMLLAVHYRASFPDLEQFRGGPAAMRGDRVHVALAADRAIPQPTSRIHYDSKQQHALVQFVAVLNSAY